MINKNEKLILAIDLGGTSVKYAFANYPEGKILHKFMSEVSAKDKVIPEMKIAVEKELEKLDLSYDQLICIAFACKGPFDDKKGLVINAGGIGWFNYPAKEVAEEVFGIPVYLNNDSRSAAIGEWKKGKGRNYKNFICLTLGNGIGCGIVLNNEIWKGSSNMAGEIGHGGRMQETHKCACGLEYCTEGQSNALGIEQSLEQYAFNNPGSKLHEIYVKSNNKISLKDCNELLNKGDELANKALESALEPLSKRISLALFLLDLEAVFIGGGPSNIGEPLIKAIKNTLKEYLWEHILNKVVIDVCDLKNDAGVVGIVQYAIMCHKEKGN